MEPLCSRWLGLPAPTAGAPENPCRGRMPRPPLPALSVGYVSADNRCYLAVGGEGKGGRAAAETGDVSATSRHGSRR